MKQMILKIDDEAETPKGVNSAGQLVGSKSWYNKKLILALSDLTVEELEDLDLSVVAIEGEPLSVDGFESYMNDIIIFDEEGEELSSDTFRHSDLETIQTFAGRKWQL